MADHEDRKRKTTGTDLKQESALKGEGSGNKTRMKTRRLSRGMRRDPDTVLERIRHYCAYQERCVREVDLKLMQWKIAPDQHKKIIRLLQEEGFIDEDRFARLFVRGKFHVNKWGKLKIRYELRNRSIPEAIIAKSLDEIGEEDYQQTIRELILRKMSEINSSETPNIREKIINFVTGKGFELYLVTTVLSELNI